MKTIISEFERIVKKSPDKVFCVFYSQNETKFYSYKNVYDQSLEVSKKFEESGAKVLELTKKIGLKPKRRIEFFTSKIDCRLLEYELYAGTKRVDKLAETV